MSDPSHASASPAGGLNLGQVAGRLWRGKWLIGGVGLGAAVVTFLIGLSLPAQYRARAKVAHGYPLAVPQSTIKSWQARMPTLAELQRLAKSAQVRQRLWRQGRAAGWIEPDATPAQFQARFRDNWRIAFEGVSEARPETQLGTLTVAGPDPERIVRGANAWGRVLSDYINTRFPVDDASFKQLQSRLASARQQMEAAAANLADTLIAARPTALEAQMEALRADYAYRSETMRRLRERLADSRSMRRQLAQNASSTQPISRAGWLNLLGLQRSGGARLEGLQIELPARSTSANPAATQPGEPPTAAAARAALGQTIAAGEDQLATLDQATDALAEALVAGAGAGARAEHQRQLARNQLNVAQQVYLDMKKGMNQIKLFRDFNLLRLTDEAVKPHQPIPRLGLNTALSAGVLAGLLTAALCIWLFRD